MENQNEKKEEEEEKVDGQSKDKKDKKSENKSNKNSSKEEKKTEEKENKISNKEDKKSESKKSRKSISKKSQKVSNKEENNKENSEKEKNKEDKNDEKSNKEKEKSQNEKNENNNINNENNEEEGKKEEEKNKDKVNPLDNIDINDIDDIDINNLPEENLSNLEKENDENISYPDIEEKEKEEENEKTKNENIRDKNTENEEIIQIKKKKKPKDKFFKNILNKKYKFKYMRAFYEEAPENFNREYSIINFNDLFTSNDFFYLYVDIEINDMIYKRALKEDCRSFFQMYWSFLKYKNNFIFSFIKDYFNFIPVKLSILVYSLSLYPFISCIFITDELLHKIYTKSNENKKHEILMNYSTSIIQYIFSPIIVDFLFFAFKKLVLTEDDIINIIHKKKYHSNYILQEMVKGYDVRDEKDEYEKEKILYIIQNQNKKKVKENEENEKYYGTGENYEEGNNNYEKEFEANKTLINEIRVLVNNFPSKINNRQSLFYIAVIILSFFHFYYVSIFTMVYYNCIQKLIYSSVISLGINFIYPFLNCLIFVSIRYFGLNHGFKNYYKLSKILSFL